MIDQSTWMLVNGLRRAALQSCEKPHSTYSRRFDKQRSGIGLRAEAYLEQHGHKTSSHGTTTWMSVFSNTSYFDALRLRRPDQLRVGQ